MADRQVFRERVEVRPRFRCLVCRRFVIGTDHGTCPQCGWQPPRLTTTRSAPHRGSLPWLALVGALLVIVLAALR